MTLLIAEIRRAMHRRLVWILLGLALVGSVGAGVIVFVDSMNLDLGAVRGPDDLQASVMADWWSAVTGKGILQVAAFMLLLGGLFGGASLVGAEWRAGTITTVLTWESRRLRLHAARTAAAAVCAIVIAFGLQVVFLAAFVPSVLAHGTVAGTSGSWFISLVAAAARAALLTGLAAVIGASLATIGRNTAAAVIASFGWLVVIENLARALRPGWTRFLVGENLQAALTWVPLRHETYGRGPALALFRLLVYTAALAVAGGARFARHDIATT